MQKFADWIAGIGGKVEEKIDSAVLSERNKPYTALKLLIVLASAFVLGYFVRGM